MVPLEELCGVASLAAEKDDVSDAQQEARRADPAAEQPGGSIRCERTGAAAVGPMGFKRGVQPSGNLLLGLRTEYPYGET
jgi:hypothetical protein